MTEINHDYKEEEYFDALCVRMLELGLDEDKIEDNVHRIMDAWTFDGVLNYEALDGVIEGWINVSVASS